MSWFYRSKQNKTLWIADKSEVNFTNPGIQYRGYNYKICTKFLTRTGLWDYHCGGKILVGSICKKGGKSPDLANL
jgi:hypothetical protein